MPTRFSLTGSGPNAHRPRRVLLAGEATLADAKRLLYNRYRVPVCGLEEVPDWVIGNLRGEGPPPVEALLDLDMLGLHV
jgi:hypothetical protein